MWQQLLTGTLKGEMKALARSLSLVENEVEGYFELLQQLPASTTPIIGITGPPGAGKSTLTDALIAEITSRNKKVGVICVDPSSPFNLGALLGDRIRMSQWYNHPNVYIRSLATRGGLGGLHPKIIEIADVMKAAPFHYIIIETVGVGQSEVEIAGLADTTVVVLVPEAGDDVQTMKAGLMEIADIFVVNKADRPGAQKLVNSLQQMLTSSPRHSKTKVPVLQTIASNQTGIGLLYEKIIEHQDSLIENNKRNWLLTEKVYHLVQQNRMKSFDKKKVNEAISNEVKKGSFNLYRFVAQF